MVSLSRCREPARLSNSARQITGPSDVVSDGIIHDEAHTAQRVPLANGDHFDFTERSGFVVPAARQAEMRVALTLGRQPKEFDLGGGCMGERRCENGGIHKFLLFVYGKYLGAVRPPDNHTSLPYFR